MSKMRTFNVFSIGDRVYRYKSAGTVVALASDPSNGFIVQMDEDQPGAVIMVAGYLLRSRPASRATCQS